MGKEPFSELKRTILKTIFARRITLGTFAAVALIVALTSGISWLNPLFYAPLAWFLITFPFQYLIRRQTDENTIHWIHACYFIVETLIITLFVYLTGGSQWIGNVFYLFTVMYANFFLPEVQGYIVTALVVLLYALVVMLEYTGILPYQFLFPVVGDLHKSLSYNLTTILAGTAAIYGVLTYTVRSFTNIYMRKNRILDEQRNRLSALSQQLVNAQNEERMSIAHELHDNLNQSLAAVKLSLSSLHKRRPDAQLPELIAIIDQAISETRTLAYSLRPPLLDDLGLAPSIRRLAQMMEEAGRFKVITELEDDFRLTSQMESLLFSVIQEALTNAQRHAQAQTVRIDLKRNEDSIIIKVEDDGVGFVPTKSDGLGLRGIEERIGLVMGTVEISSAPGQGTTMTVEVPYAERARRDR
jgi:signal transduction histidine kinase